MDRVCVCVLVTVLVAVCAVIAASGASGRPSASASNLLKKKQENMGARAARKDRSRMATTNGSPSENRPLHSRSGRKTWSSWRISRPIPATTLSCTGGKGTGELSGDKEVKKVVLTLKGCTSPEGGCTNTTEAETIESTLLEGVLGVRKAEPKEQHNKIGLKLFLVLSYGTVFSMECGTLKTKRTVQGAIIPMLPPDTPNKMSNRFELKFMHRGTEQQPEQFEGSTSPLFEQMIGSGGWERLGVEATITLEHPLEEMEINTTCTC